MSRHSGFLFAVGGLVILPALAGCQSVASRLPLSGLFSSYSDCNCNGGYGYAGSSAPGAAEMPGSAAPPSAAPPSAQPSPGAPSPHLIPPQPAPAGPRIPSAPPSSAYYQHSSPSVVQRVRNGWRRWNPFRLLRRGRSVPGGMSPSAMPLRPVPEEQLPTTHMPPQLQNAPSAGSLRPTPADSAAGSTLPQQPAQMGAPTADIEDWPYHPRFSRRSLVQRGPTNFEGVPENGPPNNSPLAVQPKQQFASPLRSSVVAVPSQAWTFRSARYANPSQRNQQGEGNKTMTSPLPQRTLFPVGRRTASPPVSGGPSRFRSEQAFPTPLRRGPAFPSGSTISRQTIPPGSGAYRSYRANGGSRRNERTGSSASRRYVFPVRNFD